MAKEFEVPKSVIKEFGELTVGNHFLLIQGSRKPCIGDGEPVMLKTGLCEAKVACRDSCRVFIDPATPVASSGPLRKYLEKTKKK